MSTATKPTPPHTITSNRLFNFLVWINILLCAGSLGVMVYLARSDDPAGKEELTKQLYGSCETVFKMTAGAFIGLLGGRAAAPDPKK